MKKVIHNVPLFTVANTEDQWEASFWFKLYSSTKQTFIMEANICNEIRIGHSALLL